ncbi:MAG: AmmeMemoRadiSam system protein B [Raoultibacter sp.]
MSIIAAYALPHPPLIIPSVGHGEERAIQDTIDAYREVARRVADHVPDTVVVASPHATSYYDYFHIAPGEAALGSMATFGAPEERLSVRYDTEFVQALSAAAAAAGLAAGTEGARDAALDHASFVPLWFLSQKSIDYRVVRLGLSGLSAQKHYELGQTIAQVAAELDRRVVFIASGDLSHKLTKEGPYGFSEEGPVFDWEISEIFMSGKLRELLEFDNDFCEAAAECGMRSFQIMAGVLAGLQYTAELLSYEGPFGVGYGIAAFEVARDPVGDTPPEKGRGSCSG